MQKPLNIAVMVSGIDEEYQHDILQGIHEFARNHHINICHFIAFGGMLGNPNHDAGEYNIFNLVNYDKLDGAILLTNTICSSSMKQTILNSVQKCGLPTAVIDQDIPGCYYIGIDNYTAMHEIVNHVIKAHGCRRINYISGPTNNPESLLRLQAYRDALSEHQIPVEEERIFHGLFRGQDGREAAEAFLSSELEFPEAIVSANDNMALSALITLESRGIHCPQDVIITGFDNIRSARNCTPELTSVSRPLTESGRRACEMVYHHIRQKGEQERTVILDATPVLTESCGCKHCMSDSIEDFKRNNYKIIERYNIDVRRNSRMVCTLTESDSYAKSLDKLKDCILEINCESFYLCLCENWAGTFNNAEDGSTPMDYAFNDYISEGYSRNMQVALAYRDGKFLENVPDFETSLMLPEIYEPEDAGKTYYFMPIHFRERCLGYCVICNSTFPLESASFVSWVMNISNSLENVRKMRCLSAVVKELEKLYIIDNLSGIYNRNGFSRNTQELYQYCQEHRVPVMVMFLDMDGLKHINDTYGHKSGDIAIRAMGQCLKLACKDGEIYSRFGGDEFLVFAVNYTEEKAKLLKLAILEEFRNYNETHSNPFDIEASIGYHIEVPQPDMPVFSLITLADQKMYEQKKRKKTSRYLRR